MSDQTASDDLATLRDLLADTHICMLTTLDADGAPWSRPMALQAAEFDGDLWFFTNAGEPKLEHIARNPNVGVAVSRVEENDYVSMAGTATSMHDPVKAKELWSEPLRAWFPDGPESDDLRLIHVDVARAEYWDSPSSTLVQLVGYVKAVATGEPAQGEPSDHGRVNL